MNFLYDKMFNHFTFNFCQCLFSMFFKMLSKQLSIIKNICVSRKQATEKFQLRKRGYSWRKGAQKISWDVQNGWAKGVLFTGGFGTSMETLSNLYQH